VLTPGVGAGDASSSSPAPPYACRCHCRSRRRCWTTTRLPTRPAMPPIDGPCCCAGNSTEAAARPVSCPPHLGPRMPETPPPHPQPHPHPPRCPRRHHGRRWRRRWRRRPSGTCGARETGDRRWRCRGRHVVPTAGHAGHAGCRVCAGQCLRWWPARRQHHVAAGVVVGVAADVVVAPLVEVTRHDGCFCVWTWRDGCGGSTARVPARYDCSLHNPATGRG